MQIGSIEAEVSCLGEGRSSGTALPFSGNYACLVSVMMYDREIVKWLSADFNHRSIVRLVQSTEDGGSQGLD